MTATGLVLSGVGPAAWYLVGAWRRGRCAEPSTPLCSPEDARALETMRRRADAVRRGEIKVASAEEIRERGRRWREETLLGAPPATPSAHEVPCRGAHS